METFYWEACGILGGPHMWHITCNYLVILLCLGISLEGELVETLLVILGGVYLLISWNFRMVKTLIRPYLPRFVFSEVSHLLFWVTTSSCTSSMELVALGFAHVGWFHASCGPHFIFGG
jgi:hypothetical protein